MPDLVSVSRQGSRLRVTLRWTGARCPRAVVSSPRARMPDISHHPPAARPATRHLMAFRLARLGRRERAGAGVETELTAI
ncbi:hypothetical protein GCM10010302_40660 [Streptomyces polychromogenes]|uniref:Uncharacterized protein n=1 Tax=Streptomyces polychromogenes TaxID=67342 RepID=A0ABN0VG93_9ACTN